MLQIGLILLLICIPFVGFAKKSTVTKHEVIVYNTYLTAPFIDGSSFGLASELVDFLNKTLKEKYQFKLLNLPRMRFVNVELASPSKLAGISIFLAPQFVGDLEMKKHQWTIPIFKDFNLLVFKKSVANKVKTLSDLNGMVFGGMRGNRYLELDELVMQKKLERLDSNSELNNFRMVAHGRIDFMQTNSLLYGSLMQNPEFAKSEITFVRLPEIKSFERRILVGRGAPAELLSSLNMALSKLGCDRHWREDLAVRLHFELPPCKGR